MNLFSRSAQILPHIRTVEKALLTVAIQPPRSLICALTSARLGVTVHIPSMRSARLVYLNAQRGQLLLELDRQASLAGERDDSRDGAVFRLHDDFGQDDGEPRALSAPTHGAITQARQRLGTEAVKEVFQQIAWPAATEWGAWLNRRRVMAIDGFVVDLPDTEANGAEFGRDSAGGYETAFPQARVVAISECASHAIVAADVAGCWAGERAGRRRSSAREPHLHPLHRGRGGRAHRQSHPCGRPARRHPVPSADR
ncbi:hypothetical protein ACFXJ8_15275 [Nonomuraea sp. NPDC059194]|uniref:hypothetical protein n=1 Tax=Nonomuraea sp. NPDC059194 TaxID=3346764 RepID=UPI0036BD8FF7